jgi:hypothetical protein
MNPAIVNMTAKQVDDDGRTWNAVIAQRVSDRIDDEAIWDVCATWKHDIWLCTTIREQ